jgi:type I restriction enzyme, R subunit
VFKIDKDYVTKLDELPTPADKAAALEAVLTRELSEDDPSFIYRQLGERLQRVKERIFTAQPRRSLLATVWHLHSLS